MKSVIKRFYLFLVVISSITLLTSCDDDTMDAYDLNGSWQGNFGMEFNGYFASQTWITFIKDRDKSGYGYQRDFYSNGMTIDYDIDWWVTDGNIYIEYYDMNGFRYPDLQTVISDYRLDNSHFTGRVGNTRFQLFKIDDWQ